MPIWHLPLPAWSIDCVRQDPQTIDSSTRDAPGPGSPSEPALLLRERGFGSVPIQYEDPNPNRLSRIRTLPHQWYSRAITVLIQRLVSSGGVETLQFRVRRPIGDRGCADRSVDRSSVVAPLFNRR